MNRVFSSLDPKVFGQYFIEWTQEICRISEGDLVAIDGKTIRRSYDKNGSKSAIHVVSAYAEKDRICLGQIQTEEKSNEITAIPELLHLLFLKGASVTIDTMGCQKNQQALYEEIENQFLISKAQSEHVDHGRSEIRKCTLINELTSLDERKSGKDLSSVLKVETERYDKPSGETRLYISSHKNNTQYHNEIIRGHSSIENRLHWMLSTKINLVEEQETVLQILILYPK